MAPRPRLPKGSISGSIPEVLFITATRQRIPKQKRSMMRFPPQRIFSAQRPHLNRSRKWQSQIPETLAPQQMHHKKPHRGKRPTNRLQHHSPQRWEIKSQLHRHQTSPDRLSRCYSPHFVPTSGSFDIFVAIVASKWEVGVADGRHRPQSRQADDDAADSGRAAMPASHPI